MSCRCFCHAESSVDDDDVVVDDEKELRAAVKFVPSRFRMEQEALDASLFTPSF